MADRSLNYLELVQNVYSSEMHLPQKVENILNYIEEIVSEARNKDVNSFLLQVEHELKQMNLVRMLDIIEKFTADSEGLSDEK